nr:unnamed protein product [Digitaria exilis]
MAELAIEISKTAVETLVNKVKSAIKEEAEKWQIVERDIVFIKDEFEMMQSFLNTASRESMKNQVARTWVRQVRDLSYDTEDCIEFVIHLDTKRLFWRRLLRSNMVQTLLPLDQAVAEIKQLKARAEQVNQRNMRYNLIGNSGEQEQQTSAPSKSSMDIFFKPRDAFDKHNSFSDLTGFLNIEEQDLQVVSVCGTGGDLGTISIIKKAYDDPDICKKFVCRAWVKMMNPFNPQEFIRSLLAGLYSPQEQGACVGVNVLASMKTTQDSILVDFMTRLQKNKYFIVIEDLRSVVEWNTIRSLLLDMNNGSRIIVSTQKLDIASLCTGQPYHVSLLREFSTDHSVYTFYKDLRKIPQDNKQIDCTCESVRDEDSKNWQEKHWQEKHSLFGRNSELNKLFQQLVINYGERLIVMSVCGIVGVGKSFLFQAFCNHHASKNAFMFRAKVNAPHPFDIMNFCRNLVLCFKLPSPDDETLIVLCWKHLEENQCLLVIDALWSKEDWDLIEANLISRDSKSCIIVITRDESIARHCAMSEDAMCNVQGLEADAALRLFEKDFPQVLKKCIFYLKVFTQSSTIRRSRLVRRWIAEGYSVGTDSNSIVEYTEKLIHELATLGMMEHAPETPTVAGDRTSCQINSLFLDYIISQETEENIFLPLEVSVLLGESGLSTERAGQHLAIASSWKRDKFVFDSLDFSQLRSLTVSREWRTFFISDRMRVLRVLDLEETNVKDEDIEQIVKQVPRLKFLSLRRCMSLSCLPESLGDLRQLETLDIRHTPVTKLPKSIKKLNRLQYIRASTRVEFAGHEPSTQRRSIHGHLDVCDGIVVPRGIGSLTALHTFGVLNISARGGKAILNALKNLTQLHKLGVSGMNRSNIKGFFSAIATHSHLQSLSLQLHKDKDYDWLDSAAWSTPGQFCELKVLEIACSSNLHVKFAEREMNDLELLKVHRLDGSSLQLSGIEHPSPAFAQTCLAQGFI